MLSCESDSVLSSPSRSSRRSATSALLVIVLAFAVPDLGCRRIRAWRARHRPAVSRVVRSPSAASPASTAPSRCENATATATPIETLTAPEDVGAMAVAALDRPSYAVLALVGERMQFAARPGVGGLQPIGDAVPGDIESSPVIIVARGEYATAWRRRRADREFTVFARYGRDGHRIGDEHVTQLDAGRPGVSLSAGETGFALAYVTENAVAVQMLGPNGAPSAPPALMPGSGHAASVAVTWCSPMYYAAWSAEGTDHVSRVTFASVPPTGGAPRAVSAVVVNSADSEMALGATRDHFAMVVADSVPDGGTMTVGSTAFAPSGLRESTIRPLSSEAIGSAPALASTGTAFAAVWADRSGDGTVRYRWSRVDARGQPIEPTLTVAGPDSAASVRVAPAIAWNGDGFVLARAGATASVIAVHRLGPNGCDSR